MKRAVFYAYVLSKGKLTVRHILTLVGSSLANTYELLEKVYNEYDIEGRGWP